MKTTNTQIREQIEKNNKIFTVIRQADIALQFRSAMVAKGIKVKDVAERLGVTPRAVSRWLSGSHNLNLDTLYGLADAIGEKLTICLETNATQGK